ncbi:MAG: hypothetical protein MUD01_02925 [Chloroflexaceae bacterium]|jgi:hypothetical protein|nr:hypothetical protein [Chloroflexaceae bacterium]
MQRFGWFTALVSAVVMGTVAFLNYSALVIAAPTLIANSSLAGGSPSASWASPNWPLPLATLIIALVSGWLAYQQGTTEVRGLGLRAGAWAGFGALVGITVVFAAMLFAIGSDPGVQEFVRASEPHPEARLPYAAIAPLAAGVGALLGLVTGFFSLLAALIGGLLVDLFLAGGRTGDISRPAH